MMASSPSDQTAVLILDQSGHRKLLARRQKVAKAKKAATELANEPKDIAEARSAFDACVAQGWTAYSIEGHGNVVERGALDDGKRITEYDPSAKLIVMHPPLRRG